MGHWWSDGDETGVLQFLYFSVLAPQQTNGKNAPLLLAGWLCHRHREWPSHCRGHQASYLAGLCIVLLNFAKTTTAPRRRGTVSGEEEQERGEGREGGGETLRPLIPATTTKRSRGLCWLGEEGREKTYSLTRRTPGRNNKQTKNSSEIELGYSKHTARLTATLEWMRRTPPLPHVT